MTTGKKILYLINPSNTLNMEFLRELFQFMKARKKWWLVPMVVVLLLLGVLLVIGGGSAAAPFIYTLF